MAVIGWQRDHRQGVPATPCVGRGARRPDQALRPPCGTAIVMRVTGGGRRYHGSRLRYPLVLKVQGGSGCCGSQKSPRIIRNSLFSHFSTSYRSSRPSGSVVAPSLVHCPYIASSSGPGRCSTPRRPKLGSPSQVTRIAALIHPSA